MSDSKKQLSHSTYTNLFVLKKKINKRDDGTLRGWMYGKILDDEWISLKIQEMRSPLFDTINRTLTFFGGELFNVIILPCLFWWAPMRFACTYSYMLGSTFAFGNYFKNIFALPRPRSPPVWRTSERLESDWGFPSTHTIGSCLLPPFVAWYLTVESFPEMPLWGKLLIYVIAFIWIVGVSLSRIYLGAHSPLDVYGAMICACILGLFWHLSADIIYEMVIADSFPYVAFFAPLFFLVIHPISTPVTPLTGDSATLLGMSAGITLGVWVRVHLLSIDSLDTTAQHGSTLTPSLAELLSRDAGFADWLNGGLVAVTKFFIGTLLMLVVRHVAKLTLRTIAIQFASKFTPSETDSIDKSEKSVQSAAHNLRSRKKTDLKRTNRESMLDEVTAEEDFFLNVDLPVKYGTYLCLGFVGTCGAPLLFSILGL